MTGLEPVTSSLPRKCSTAELHWHLFLERKTRLKLATLSLVSQQIYSLPHLATLVFALILAFTRP